jgi:Rieske Fe-S protein
MIHRRRFMSMLTSLIGAAIAAILAVPAVGYVLSPFRRQKGSEGEAGFLDAGPWSDLTEAGPQLVIVEMTHQDGWVKSRFRHSIWVRKTGTDSAVVLSPICPHLGCPVNWSLERKEYACPCHASFFDTEGKVLSGPAPRGLDPLSYEIRDGRLWIRWIYFRQGTAEREAVTV